eukprot:1138096-Pelagomonas_calceolata.AAC.2
MSTGRASPIVFIAHTLSLFIGEASKLSYARPVIGSVADITDIHIKIKGFRVQGFFANRIVADLTAGTTFTPTPALPSGLCQHFLSK